MKKILTIFLTITLLLLTPISIYAQDIVTEETAVEEDITTTEEETTVDDTSTTLAETLDEDVNSGISVWTVLFAIVGASLFVGVAYMILKNFNL